MDQFEPVDQESKSDPNSVVDVSESGLDDDPTHRIGHLEIARKKPISVKPTATVEQAMMIMMHHGFSQIPIMPSSTKVKGMFNWRSLAQRLAFGNRPVTVTDAMETAIIVSAKRSLFEAAKLIFENDYVLIQDEGGAICGILTSSDLSMTFSERSEPFLRLEQIEKHIRNRVRGKLTDEDVRLSLKVSKHEKVDVRSLTFGEYVRILKSPDNWKKLGLPIDREMFVKELDDIRLIRNRAMHFDPNGISASDLKKLRDFAHLMRQIQKATD